MNRHDRRAAQAGIRPWARGIKALRDASECRNGTTCAMQYELFSLERLYMMPGSRIERGVIDWARNIPKRHPVCLLCTHEWHSCDDQLLPAAFVWTRPFDESKTVVSLLSAICSNCFYSRPDTLGEEIKAAMRRLFGPDAKFHDVDSPSSMQ